MHCARSRGIVLGAARAAAKAHQPPPKGLPKARPSSHIIPSAPERAAMALACTSVHARDRPCLELRSASAQVGRLPRIRGQWRLSLIPCFAFGQAIVRVAPVVRARCPKGTPTKPARRAHGTRQTASRFVLDASPMSLLQAVLHETVMARETVRSRRAQSLLYLDR